MERTPCRSIDCPSLFIFFNLLHSLFSLFAHPRARPRTLASSGRYRSSEFDGGESETCSRRASAAASERSTGEVIANEKREKNGVEGDAIHNEKGRRWSESFNPTSPALLARLSLTALSFSLSLFLLHMALGSLTKFFEVRGVDFSKHGENKREAREGKRFDRRLRS